MRKKTGLTIVERVKIAVTGFETVAKKLEMQVAQDVVQHGLITWSCRPIIVLFIVSSFLTSYSQFR